MTFHSILREKKTNRTDEETTDPPEFFSDLNLDQIVNAIIKGREEYDLKTFFYSLPADIDTIRYRQAIMREMENESLFACIKTFTRKMHEVREHAKMVGKLYYKYHKEGWFLDGAHIYCTAVDDLARDLSGADIKSSGFRAFHAYLDNYVKSPDFMSFMLETEKLRGDLSQIRYSLIIKGNTIKVRAYESESDYSKEIEEVFSKFKQGATKDYRVNFPERSDMSHVEAGILNLIAKLDPNVFLSLDSFVSKYPDYLDKTIISFDREVQFYIAYLEYLRKFKQAGLQFCYPGVSNESKEVHSYGGFDLALGDKLISEKLPVVCNDFYLSGKERVIVVSGPNQGGKTTFARVFGQLHYFAGIGCPVPGREASLFLSDGIFTHFEREEKIENLRGKLQDDLIRIHSILKKTTSKSILIMNEIFTSTTLKDAVLLSNEIMREITAMDILCVWVTFIDELASFSQQTVSMVSTVVPESPAVRTYKIVRKPADGLSYALSVAEKHRLTYNSLKERLMS